MLFLSAPSKSPPLHCSPRTPTKQRGDDHVQSVDSRPFRRPPRRPRRRQRRRLFPPFQPAVRPRFTGRRRGAGGRPRRRVGSAAAVAAAAPRARRSSAFGYQLGAGWRSRRSFAHALARRSPRLQGFPRKSWRRSLTDWKKLSRTKERKNFTLDDTTELPRPPCLLGRWITSAPNMESKKLSAVRALLSHHSWISFFYVRPENGRRLFVPMEDWSSRLITIDKPNETKHTAVLTSTRDRWSGFVRKKKDIRALLNATLLALRNTRRRINSAKHSRKTLLSLLEFGSEKMRRCHLSDTYVLTQRLIHQSVCLKITSQSVKCVP